jgi:hypothetical protein
MARGTQLSIALTMLKNKIKANVYAGVAASNDYSYCIDIYRKQQWLATQYDWPFLEERWDIQLVPYPQSPANPTNFQPWRYYNFPTLDEDNNIVAINFERPSNAYVWWSDSWLDVDVGIGIEEFNFRNSDGTPPNSGAPPDQLDPVQRWQWNDQAQFEVWPIPASNQVFRIVGQRVCQPLIDFPNATPLMANTLDLDDELVTLYVAAEILADMGKGNARVMATDAANRMSYIRASYPRRTKACGFGKNVGKELQRLIPVKKNIAVA